MLSYISNQPSVKNHSCVFSRPERRQREKQVLLKFRKVRNGHSLHWRVQPRFYLSKICSRKEAFRTAIYGISLLL